MKKHNKHSRTTNDKEPKNSPSKDSASSSPMVKENELDEKIDAKQNEEKSNPAYDEWSVSWP
jgi:hypothetical protein